MSVSSDPTINRKPQEDNLVISPPFPKLLKNTVVKGFGRGSKELGIPTANYPQDYVDSASLDELSPGIYYGYSKVYSNQDDNEKQTGEDEILPMVMSLGYNPFYKNEKLSAEVHVLHSFEKDFYGQQMTTLVLGYIRPERSYDGLDALIQDIQFDITFAKKSLLLESYKKEHFLTYFE
ncbi:riboflavin kinase [Neoconidiobolus thromboides FSU 785]|nr:riboflavin kinase [Neoconidiobolus thromboides FSU 785]